MYAHLIKLFLRLALGTAFLSAVADRFGWWSDNVSVWGSWSKFVEYTALITPWLPAGFIEAAAVVATAAEILFGICLLIGFKTEFFARWSGVLLLLFGLSMAFSTGLKASFDYSVFTAAAAAFALSVMKEKYLEIDCLMARKGKVSGNFQ